MTEIKDFPKKLLQEIEEIVQDSVLFKEIDIVLQQAKAPEMILAYCKEKKFDEYLTFQMARNAAKALTEVILKVIKNNHIFKNQHINIYYLELLILGIIVNNYNVSYLKQGVIKPIYSEAIRNNFFYSLYSALLQDLNIYIMHIPLKKLRKLAQEKETIKNEEEAYILSKLYNKNDKKSFLLYHLNLLEKYKYRHKLDSNWAQHIRDTIKSKLFINYINYKRRGEKSTDS